LQRVDVHKGDVFYIPAGLVHGIGGGVLIAEIQENSNVIYRVYDYNRKDKNGRKREIHFDKAVQVMDMNAAPNFRQKNRFIHYYPGCSREILCRCEYFEVERVQIIKRFCFIVKQESFQILLCLSGKGKVTSFENKQMYIDFNIGDCIFIPADFGRCDIVGNAELLKVRC
jgi:mannose-6-phosphate isomerase